MSVNKIEQNFLKKDKESIVAYARKIKASDAVIDSLISGCDGYPKPNESIIYDENGNRIETLPVN